MLLKSFKNQVKIKQAGTNLKAASKFNCNYKMKKCACKIGYFVIKLHRE